MDDILYKMMINNFANYFNNLTPLDKIKPDTVDAFKVSQILSIGLAKDPSKIMKDLIDASKKFREGD